MSKLPLRIVNKHQFQYDGMVMKSRINNTDKFVTHQAIEVHNIETSLKLNVLKDKQKGIEHSLYPLKARSVYVNNFSKSFRDLCVKPPIVESNRLQ